MVEIVKLSNLKQHNIILAYSSSKQIIEEVEMHNK